LDGALITVSDIFVDMNDFLCDIDHIIFFMIYMKKKYIVYYIYIVNKV